LIAQFEDDIKALRSVGPNWKFIERRVASGSIISQSLDPAMTSSGATHTSRRLPGGMLLPQPW